MKVVKFSLFGSYKFLVDNVISQCLKVFIKRIVFFYMSFDILKLSNIFVVKFIEDN